MRRRIWFVQHMSYVYCDSMPTVFAVAERERDRDREKCPVNNARVSLPSVLSLADMF